MDKKKAKMDVLDRLMANMDERIVEGMRKPKVAKVDIESNDPAMAEDLKEKLVEPEIDKSMEDSQEDDKSMVLDSEEVEPSEEDIENIRQLYNKYCR